MAQCYRAQPATHSGAVELHQVSHGATLSMACRKMPEPPGLCDFHSAIDRKSTRLNSSHGYISYAVFCLKKKNKKGNQADNDTRRTTEHNDIICAQQHM